MKTTNIYFYIGDTTFYNLKYPTETPVYIGQSIDITRRYREHVRNDGFEYIEEIIWFTVPMQKADLIEYTLINHYNPVLNRGKDYYVNLNSKDTLRCIHYTISNFGNISSMLLNDEIRLKSAGFKRISTLKTNSIII